MNPLINQQHIHWFLFQVWHRLPREANVRQRLTLAYLAGIVDSEGTITTKFRTEGINHRPASIVVCQSNPAFLQLVKSVQPFAAASSYYASQPGDGIYSHGNGRSQLRFESSGAAAVIQTLEPFLIKKAYVANRVIDWDATPVDQRTQASYDLITELQRIRVHSYQWVNFGAPSQQSFLPLHRLYWPGHGGQGPPGGWTRTQKEQYIAGLFDGDGCISFWRRGGNFILEGEISQPGCIELLDAIQSFLGYGHLDTQRGRLCFTGDEVRLFYDEIVEPHCVIRAHKYAAFLKLCFWDSHKHEDTWVEEPGPYIEALRINSKWDWHVNQDGVNWASAMEDWTGQAKPDWAT